MVYMPKVGRLRSHHMVAGRYTHIARWPSESPTPPDLSSVRFRIKSQHQEELSDIHQKRYNCMTLPFKPGGRDSILDPVPTLIITVKHLSALNDGKNKS